MQKKGIYQGPKTYLGQIYINHYFKNKTYPNLKV